jgi:hypothetical protein
MSERHSSKAALRLAQIALETLERHERNPELAIDDFISTVRANSGVAINQLLSDDDLRPKAMLYLNKMAASLEKPPAAAVIWSALSKKGRIASRR